MSLKSLARQQKRAALLTAAAGDQHGLPLRQQYVTEEVLAPQQLATPEVHGSQHRAHTQVPLPETASVRQPLLLQSPSQDRQTRLTSKLRLHGSTGTLQGKAQGNAQATTSTNCMAQVSARPTSEPPIQSHIHEPHVHMQNVVRVQRLMHRFDILEDSEDVESWSMVHIISERIDTARNEKMIRVRIANGEEEELFSGQVHRP